MSKNDRTISERKNKWEKKVEAEKEKVKVEGTQPEIESSLEVEGTQPEIESSLEVEGTQPEIESSLEVEGTQPEIESSLEELEFPSREKLEDQLTSMEHKVEEYKNQFLRAKAEIDNLCKRTEREKADAIKYGTSQLLTDLLPVVDSLIHGLQSLESQDPCAKNMREGMSLTLDLLQKVLVKHGVEIIDPQLGDSFNPEFHEAMSIQKILTAKSDTIVQVMQKGYQLNGRVLRASRVVVAE